MCLEAAVEAAAGLLNKAERPVLVAGVKLRLAKSCEAFVDLANACGYAITAMPAAKGLVPENHPQFMGTYWGRPTSSPLCAETVESADACLYAVFDDLSTNGYTIHLDKEKSIIVQPQRVAEGGLEGRCPVQACTKDGVERITRSDSVVVVEAGDAWFYTQKLKLPQGCGSIIFLTNNGGYAIEAKIHDGPYNVIKKWDYTALVNAIHNGHGNLWAAQVRCEEELVAAVDMAMGDKKDYLCLIEVMLHKHDTSKELLHWVAKLVDANASPPCPS
ncbi:Pyruvate decarboxylase [Actinidia chinensis var. chinensis]|uniref:pyruvate decarboxylase n=1 Tax=Actinidia chinensis var. chinensis TaxID=1590841 RepID=A0A2R6QK93_ACTCC|nr:Pyruvate decarboxylase [Actinidia chinensis var. chinensis]